MEVVFSVVTVGRSVLFCFFFFNHLILKITGKD